MTVEPDLRISHLSIWVSGRQFPNSSDFWDGNWLIVRAEWSQPHAFIRAGGPILHLSELAVFLKGCERLYESFEGVAELDCIEPNIHARFTARTVGHIDLEVKLTPDHMAQQHRFMETIDQTYLPPIIEGARAILEKYPIREPEKFHGGV